MNYSTNEVQVSDFVELPRSNIYDYTNSLTLSLTLGLFHRLFPDLAEFPDISRKVVTL